MSLGLCFDNSLYITNDDDYNNFVIISKQNMRIRRAKINQYDFIREVFTMGDFHVHTNISPCAVKEATVDSYLKKCKKEGLTTIGFTNHLWDQDAKKISPDEWYSLCSLESVLSLKKDLKSIMQNVKVYFGCETDIHFDGTIALTKEHAKYFDYVLIAMSHYHNSTTIGTVDINDTNVMKPLAIKRFKIACNADFGVPTCICHPFLPFGVKNIEEHLEQFTDEEYMECFLLAKSKGISIELSSANIDKQPSKYNHFDESGFVYEYIRMMKIAKKSGVKVQLGSDAHCIDDFLVHKEMIKFAKVCGFKESDFISEINE